MSIGSANMRAVKKGKFSISLLKHHGMKTYEKMEVLFHQF